MSRGATLLLTLTLLLPLACGEPTPAVAEPGRTALALFDLAVIDEPSQDDLRMFALEPDLEARAALLDALSVVAEASAVELVEIQPVGEDAYADLTAELHGGSQARFSVRLHPVPSGDWQITWFQGPGVEWPPSKPQKGEGLSTSMP